MYKIQLSLCNNTCLALVFLNSLNCIGDKIAIKIDSLGLQLPDLLNVVVIVVSIISMSCYEIQYTMSCISYQFYVW